MNNTRVSYSFGTVTTYIDEQSLPNTGDDPAKYSINFVQPSGTLDYVPSSTGGNFFGLVSYGSTYTLSNPLNFTYKSWVEGFVAQELADLIAEGGGLGADDIRALFSSSASTPLTYDNTTGIFTLNKNLSQYTNDTNFITLLDLPAETDPVFTAWDKSTGISITLSQISDWETPILAETDPIFSASPAFGITAQKITNWDNAFGWGNHSGLYDVTGTASGLLSTHNSTYDHTLIATALQNITGESIYDLPEMPDLGTNKQVLRSNGSALVFATMLHSDLGTVLGSSDGYHLSAAEVVRVQTAASATTDGYLTATKFAEFDAKLTNFTAGNLLEIVGTTINVLSTVKPVNDSDTTVNSTWSAAKIMEMLAGSEEDGEYSKSYTISIPAGADLATKLGFGATGPTGWAYAAVGGSSSDLQITHNMSKTPVSIAIFRVNADGTKSKLEGAVAYGDAKSTTTDTKLILSSYANTSLATEIRIIF